MVMTIYLNGKKEEIENNINILRLLEAKKIRPEVVTVELNEKIIEKDRYKNTALKPNDKLEFVYYMGGGGSTLRLHSGSNTERSRMCSPHFVRSPLVRR